MSYNLFLDDIRNPSDVTWVSLPKQPWIIVRTVEEFESIVLSKGVPRVVSFDHDLGALHYQGVYLDNKTGLDAARWLKNYCNDCNIPIPIIYVHSMNPVGRINIINVFNKGD